MSPRSTIVKFRLRPRLRLCCLYLLRRPCRPFFRRGSFRLGLAVVALPLLASLRPPWIAKIAPASERLAFSDCTRALYRPSSYCADPTHHRRGHTCSVFTWYPPSEAPRRFSTPDALPETSSPPEIESLESVEQCSHTDWAREQRAEPMRDATIRYLLLGCPSVLPDDFLLRLAPRNPPPIVGRARFSRYIPSLQRRRRYPPSSAEVSAPAPACPDNPGDALPASYTTKLTLTLTLRPAAHASVDYARVPC